MSKSDTPSYVQASKAPLRLKPSNYPEPFASMMNGREKLPIGDLFGLTNFGVNFTLLPPATVSALFHAHAKQDEFVYILSGRATLVTDEGEFLLDPGMCAGFKAGTGKGHRLENKTTTDVTYLEVGDRTAGDFVSYPRDDLVALRSDAGWQFTKKDGTSY